MSNHLAIATVTMALKQLLETNLIKDCNCNEVSALPPDDPSLKNDKARLNIFLYQVAPSPAWMNADTPTRRQDGSLCNRPMMGLNLYYLLTAYGVMGKYDPEAHRVMGSVLRTLHTHPQLTHKNIKDTIDALVAQDSGSPLKTSDLANQSELIKFTHIPLNLEELSKLWSVLFQTPYRPSIAIQASVVLLESEEKDTQMSKGKIQVKLHTISNEIQPKREE